MPGNVDIQGYVFPPFRGLDLKDAPLDVPAQFSRSANFIDFDLLGAIQKAKGPARFNGIQLAGNDSVYGIYEYIQNDGDRFIIAYTSDGKFWKISSAGVATDITPANVTIGVNKIPHFATMNNLCIIGDGTNPPIYIYDAVSNATIFELGLTAPASAPSGAPGAAGVLTGAYTYKVVFVSPTGAKSNAGPASVVVNPAAQQVNLTLIPINVDTAENVSAREIYRVAAGGIVYYYVTTINDNVTTVYTDNIADTALGPRLIEEREKPPAGLRGFVEYAGSLYGYIENGHDLLYTQVNEPEAWGAFNTEPIVPGDGGPITGLGKINDLVVFKRRSIHLWQGIPGMFRRLQRSAKVGCVAHRTIRNVELPDGGDVLFFLSQYGPYAFDEERYYDISREIQPIFSGKDANHVFNASQGEKCSAEYDQQTKKYFLSICVNGATDPNLLLVYDIYAEAWSRREPFYVASLTTQTQSTGLEQVLAGDSRSDVINGGFTFHLDVADSWFGDDYEGEYITAWNPFGYPDQEKTLRYISLDLIAEGDVILFVDLYVDGEEFPRKSFPISLTIGGAIWDAESTLWDEAEFADQDYLHKIQGTGPVNGTNFSFGFRTSIKNAPWKLLKFRTRFQVLPISGDRR